MQQPGLPKRCAGQYCMSWGSWSGARRAVTEQSKLTEYLELHVTPSFGVLEDPFNLECPDNEVQWYSTFEYRKDVEEVVAGLWCPAVIEKPHITDDKRDWA